MDLTTSFGNKTKLYDLPFLFLLVGSLDWVVAASNGIKRRHSEINIKWEIRHQFKTPTISRIRSLLGSPFLLGSCTIYNGSKRRKIICNILSSTELNEAKIISSLVSWLDSVICLSVINALTRYTLVRKASFSCMKHKLNIVTISKYFECWTTR